MKISQNTISLKIVNFMQQPAPQWSVWLTAITAVLSVILSCQHLQVAREAKMEAEQANQIAQKTLELSNFTPVLAVPYGFEPYLIEDQNKAKISVLIVNLSKTHYVHILQVDFTIKDDEIGIASSRSWNKSIGRKEEPSVLPPGFQLTHSWTPDVSPKKYYQSGNYRFEFISEVTWRGMSDQCYEVVNRSLLHYSLDLDKFSFSVEPKKFEEIDCPPL